jgi:hypothetical protein
VRSGLRDRGDRLRLQLLWVFREKKDFVWLDRLAMPMLRNENGIAGRRERSQPKERNRRANESSLIVESFVGSVT